MDTMVPYICDIGHHGLSNLLLYVEAPMLVLSHLEMSWSGSNRWLRRRRAELRSQKEIRHCPIRYGVCGIERCLSELVRQNVVVIPVAIFRFVEDPIAGPQDRSIPKRLPSETYSRCKLSFIGCSDVVRNTSLVRSLNIGTEILIRDRRGILR